MSDDLSDVSLRDCQRRVKKSLETTISEYTSMPATESGLNESVARKAIASAAIQVAIDNFAHNVNFSEDQREELEVYITYLILGTIRYGEVEQQARNS